MKPQSKITLIIKSLAVSALIAVPAHMDAQIFVADFNGTGGGTGGVNDLVTSGGTGSAFQYTTATTTVPSSPTLGQGAFLHVDANGDGITTPSAGLLGGVTLAPSSNANSWQALNTVSGGNVSLHGAFDFFLRQDTIVSGLDIFDLGSHTGGGIRLIVQQNPSALRFRLYSGGTGTEGFLTGGSYTTPNVNAIMDANLTPAAGTIYHLGFTMNTDSGTGVSTMNIYGRTDTQAIDTATTDDRLGTFSFKINGANVTAGLPAGAFNLELGRSAGTGAAAGRQTSLDAFRLYDSVPAEFAAIPEPGTVWLIGVGLAGLLLNARRRKAAAQNYPRALN